MRLAWTTRAVSKTAASRPFDRSAAAPIVVDEGSGALDVASTEVPQARTEVLDGRGRSGVLPVDDDQPAVAAEHVLGADVEVADACREMLGSWQVCELGGEAGDHRRPPRVGSAGDEARPLLTTRRIAVPGVRRSARGRCVQVDAGERRGDLFVGADVGDVDGGHVQPLVDADVAEQGVPVGGASRTGERHAGGEHRFLQVDVHVGLVGRRQEQLELLDRPRSSPCPQPADTSELTASHIRQRTRRRAETEHRADLRDVHAPSLLHRHLGHLLGRVEAVLGRPAASRPDLDAAQQLGLTARCCQLGLLTCRTTRRPC